MSEAQSFFLRDKNGDKIFLSAEKCKENFLTLYPGASTSGNEEDDDNDMSVFLEKLQIKLPEVQIDDLLELIEDKILDTREKKNLFNTVVVTERGSFLAFLYLFFNNDIATIEEVLTPEMTFIGRSEKLLAALDRLCPPPDKKFYTKCFAQLTELLGNILLDIGCGEEKPSTKFGFNSYGSSNGSVNDYISYPSISILEEAGIDLSSFLGVFLRLLKLLSAGHRTITGSNTVLHQYHKDNQLASKVNWDFKDTTKAWELFIPVYNHIRVTQGIDAEVAAGFGRQLQKAFFGRKDISWGTKWQAFTFAKDEVSLNFYAILMGTMSYFFFQNIVVPQFQKRNSEITPTMIRNTKSELRRIIVECFKLSSNSHIDLTLRYNIGNGIMPSRKNRVYSQNDNLFYPLFLAQFREFVEYFDNPLDFPKYSFYGESGKNLGIPSLPSNNFGSLFTKSWKLNPKFDKTNFSAIDGEDFTLSKYVNLFIGSDDFLKTVAEAPKFVQASEGEYLTQTVFTNTRRDVFQRVLEASFSTNGFGDNEFINSFASSYHLQGLQIVLKRLGELIVKDAVGRNETEAAAIKRISTKAMHHMSDDVLRKELINDLRTILIPLINELSLEDLGLDPSGPGKYNFRAIQRTLRYVVEYYLASFLAIDGSETHFRAYLKKDSANHSDILYGEDLKAFSRACYALNKMAAPLTRQTLNFLVTDKTDLNYAYLDYIRRND